MYGIIFIAIAAVFTLYVIIKNWMGLSFDWDASIDHFQSNCLAGQTERSRAKAVALKATYNAKLAEKHVHLEAQPVKLSADLDASATAFPAPSVTTPKTTTLGFCLRRLLGLSTTTPDLELSVIANDATHVSQIATPDNETSICPLSPEPAPSALAIITPHGVQTISRTHPKRLLSSKSMSRLKTADTLSTTATIS
jgi:hypothetical protein